MVMELRRVANADLNTVSGDASTDLTQNVNFTHVYFLYLIHFRNEQFLSSQPLESKMMNPLNVKVLQNPLVATAQVSLPPDITIGHATGVNCPHGHHLAPQSSYVSFRLAAALPSTHSWGLYISQQDVDNLDVRLQNLGWAPTSSAEAAARLITAGLTSIFYLDCTLMNVHEILFLQYGPNAYQSGFDDVMRPSLDAIHYFAGEGVEFNRQDFAGDDDEWRNFHRQLGLDDPVGKNMKPQFIQSVINYLIRGKLRFSSEEALHRFILNLPRYNYRKSFPGIDLPTTIIP